MPQKPRPFNFNRPIAERTIACLGRTSTNHMGFWYKRGDTTHISCLSVPSPRRLQAGLGLVRAANKDSVQVSLFLAAGKVDCEFLPIQIAGAAKANDVIHYRLRHIGDGQTALNMEVVELPVRPTKTNLKRFSQRLRATMGDLTIAEIVATD